MEALAPPYCATSKDRAQASPKSDPLYRGRERRGSLRSGTLWHAAGFDLVVPAIRVVVAVPVPALRQITFAPPLPPQKTAALEAVSSAPVLKVLGVFAERFWERQGWDGNLATDLPLRVWHAIERQPDMGGILTCYITAASMHEVQPLSPEALPEVLLGELEPMIGPWQDTLEQPVTTDWMGDTYAGGG